MADPSLAIDRRIKNKARMSERNKELGMGYQHWDVTEEWIRAECDRHLDDPLIEELESFANRNPKEQELFATRLMYKATTFELDRLEKRMQKEKAAFESRLKSKDAEIHRLELQVREMQHSIPMQLASRHQGVVEKLFGSGTRRRRFYELGATGIRVILNEGWKSFFRKARLRGKRSEATEQP
jgi:hypothetical protein